MERHHLSDYRERDSFAAAYHCYVAFAGQPRRLYSHGVSTRVAEVLHKGYPVVGGPTNHGGPERGFHEVVGHKGQVVALHGESCHKEGRLDIEVAEAQNTERWCMVDGFAEACRTNDYHRDGCFVDQR